MHILFPCGSQLLTPSACSRLIVPEQMEGLLKAYAAGTTRMQNGFIPDSTAWLYFRIVMWSSVLDAAIEGVGTMRSPQFRNGMQFCTPLLHNVTLSPAISSRKGELVYSANISFPKWELRPDLFCKWQRDLVGFQNIFSGRGSFKDLCVKTWLDYKQSTLRDSR